MTNDAVVTPRHVGIIVDGNRRWAKKHGLPGYEGHLAGHNTFLEILPEFLRSGVAYATLYIFSTENWSRTEDEVKRLMALIVKVVTDDLHLFHENHIRIRILGTRERLSDKVLKAIDRAERETKDYTERTIGVCFNYGGQQEIADAVKKIIHSGAKAEDITPELISENLYSPDIPPLDLIVRTSGEQRISNFMLWRAAYSELIFVKKAWPDMTKEDVATVLQEYSRRQRRFGG